MLFCLCQITKYWYGASSMEVIAHSEGKFPWIKVPFHLWQPRPETLVRKGQNGLHTAQIGRHIASKFHTLRSRRPSRHHGNSQHYHGETILVDPGCQRQRRCWEMPHFNSFHKLLQPVPPSGLADAYRRTFRDLSRRFSLYWRVMQWSRVDREP